MKLALSACLSIIVTGATSWVVFGQDKVTTTGMKEYVQSRESVLIGTMQQNTKDIASLAGAVKDLTRAQQDLLVEQRVLIEQVRQLVEQGRAR